MYYPYFRGKQFELITIRETARVLADSGFVPIIEPVKESLGGLTKTLSAICKASGSAIVIINPSHGDCKENGVGICQLVDQTFTENNSIVPGVLLRNDMPLSEVLDCYQRHRKQNPTFVHAGFANPKMLVEHFREEMHTFRNVFIDGFARNLYRKHFVDSKRILVHDGFNRKRNADYPEIEEFSELHVTYKSELGMAGFGDFLIVGDNYAESGGPAYAVAIHLTFIDSENDDVMYIYHFVSDTKDTPTDPAGKFAQALNKLIRKLDSGRSKLLETSAIAEFRELHAKGHFPGLGYVKKLSMKHHIETLASYLY